MYSKIFKSFLKDYFTLTSRERKGALALSFLIFIQLLLVIWLNYLRTPHEPAIEKYNIQISNFVQRQRTEDSLNEYKKTYPLSSQIYSKNIVFFEFDPNTVSDSGWMQLGLSQKQTAIVRNFLSKGGVFRKKEDVAKIFGITEHQYLSLESFIRIPEKENNYKKPLQHFINKKKEIQKININAADTIELCNLPLIGPGRARMIYKYRLALGGFVNEKQLLEVFTMDSVVLNVISPLIIIDIALIQKVNINADEFRHPYISKQIFYAIKAYRKQHGNFAKIEDLKQLTVMNNELITKLAPYVAFQ